MISNLIDTQLKLFRELLEYWVDYDDSTDTVYFNKSRIAVNPLREEDCYEEYQKKAEAFLKESMLRVEQQVWQKLKDKIQGDHTLTYEDITEIFNSLKPGERSTKG